MARYIDADLLIETMQKRYDEICDTYGYHDLYASGYDDGVDAVENAPAADVAPKSEVERLTVELDAMRGAANTYKMHYENARKEIERLKDYNTGVAFKHYFDGGKEVAREIFEDLENFRSQFKYYGFGYTALGHKLAELKKKYAEEKE